MKFHHVAITVKDLSVSISFYENIFSFREIKRFRRDDFGGTGVMLQGENVIIELWQFDTYQKGIIQDLSISGIKHIAFTDSDPASIRETFVSRGIECRPLTHGASCGIYFFLNDSDGNEIEIYKPADFLI